MTDWVRPDYCDFIPKGDKRCSPPEPKPDDGGNPKPKPDDGGKGGDDMEKAMIDPMAGQVAFTLMAAGVLTNSALEMFRYKSHANAYDVGSVLATNWYQYVNVIGQWVGLVFGGVMTIMQILAFFGIANEINLMIWMYSGLGMMVIDAVLGGMTWWAYDQAY